MSAYATLNDIPYLLTLAKDAKLNVLIITSQQKP